MAMKIDINNFSIQWLQEAWVAKAVTMINVLLITALAYSLADLTWRLVPVVQTGALPERLPAIDSRAAQPLPARSLNIARWHLFGEKGVVSPRSVNNMPETRLNLTLYGVVASDHPELSGAIIAAPGKKERFYAVAEDVGGGAVLTEVHEDRVVLLRNGQYETLRLPRQTAGDTGPGIKSSTVDRAVPARTLREYRDTLLRNPRELTNLVSIQPFVESGRVAGYQVRPGKDNALFQQLGFQPGDVVTAVNGISLDSPAKGLSILRTLSGRAEIRVDIRRNGVPQSLTVDMNRP